MVKYPKKMKSDSVIYSCFGKSIKIGLPFPSQHINLKFWLERFCPGIVEDINSKAFDYQIDCSTYIQNKYRVISENSIILYSSWDYDYSSFLAKFVTQVFQRLLNTNGLYIIPCACVTKNGKAVLFIGDYWQGKTSVALNTFKLDKEVEIVSDNYVIIKNNKVLCGTKYLSLREENITRYKSIINTNSIKIVNARKYFEYNNSKKQGEIVGFIIPYINIGDDNFHIVSNEEAIWYLYQKLSNIIKGDTVLFNGQYPSPNLDNKTLSINRLKYINRLLTKSKLFYSSSNIDKISTYTLQILQGEI